MTVFEMFIKWKSFQEREQFTTNMEESQQWILLQRLRRERLELEMVVCKFFSNQGITAILYTLHKSRIDIKRKYNKNLFLKIVVVTS